MICTATPVPAVDVPISTRAGRWSDPLSVAIEAAARVATWGALEASYGLDVSWFVWPGNDNPHVYVTVVGPTMIVT